MAIVKPAKQKQEQRPDAAADFIAAAPDAEQVAAGVIRGKKRVITVGLDPDSIRLIDEKADALGISRNAWISMVLHRALASEA